MSKDFGSSLISGQRSSKQGSKKSKSTQSKGSKKHKKVKSLQDRNSYEKLHGESSHKSRNFSKKKTLDTYELVLHSSEDDLYGYNNELEIDADLGWDPITYYPLPRKVPEVFSPIQLQDLSSHAGLGPKDYDPHCKLDMSSYLQ